MNLRNNFICFMMCLLPLLFFATSSVAQVSVQPDKSTHNSNKVNSGSRCSEIMKHPATNSPTALATNNKAQNPPIHQFTDLNIKWSLKSIDIDINLMLHNRANYQDLLQEVIADLSGSIAYYESNDHALLTLYSGQFHPIYYGKIQRSSNDISMSHYDENCPSCSKNVSYTRVYNPDQTLTFRLQDEDDDKTDVFYVLTFEK